MNEKEYKLTKYPLGSVREIFSISWPLMVGLLSNSMMFFLDRLILSRYSVDSMNAAAISGTLFFGFVVLPLIICGISEVFVGQFNGRGESSELGKPAWQMIWFAIFLIPIFILISIFVPDLIFYNKSTFAMYERDYFRLLIAFASTICISQAMNGYFAGQGIVIIIAVGNILANVVNVILDIVLIFGFKNIPAMGIKGAAIATICGQFFLLFFFFFFFIKDRNKYGTLKVRIVPKLFKSCLKIGFPASIAHVSETFAHFVFFYIMSLAGEEYLTISVLVQTYYLLFMFAVEGVAKGVTAVCSNFIGAKKLHLVGKTLFSAYKLHVIFWSVFFMIFLLFSSSIFNVFFPVGSKDLLLNTEFYSTLYKTFIMLSIFWLCDGFGWASIGMLVAAGDTKFIMIIGIFAPWILFLLPTYVGINYFSLKINQVWLWIVVYGIIIFLIYFFRYLTGKWKKIKIYNHD